jgi:hypothetical protein
MIGNECIRFGRHINIQVSRKILQFEVQKQSINFAQYSFLSKGVVFGQFELNTAIDV